MRRIQGLQMVYRCSNGGGDDGLPPAVYYYPHRIMGENPRYFWVDVEMYREEAEEEYQAHPEWLRTYRMDRLVLEAGEEYLHRASGYAPWVLFPPEGAVEQPGTHIWEERLC